MTVPAWLKVFDRFIAGCRKLTQSKGHDYSGTEDTLRNLKAVERVDICSSETGCLVRMQDKMSRLAQLVARGRRAKVTDEKVDDTLKDLVNYAVLLHALREEKKDAEG